MRILPTVKIRPMPPTISTRVPAGAAPAQAPRFALPLRVYYEDTDSGGVVYYANYLRFFERCRTEWMRALGFGQRELAERERVVFVVASAQIEYLRPARLDDALSIDAVVAERGSGSIVFEQRALRGDETLCRARIKIACVDAVSLRPTRLPPAVAAALLVGSDELGSDELGSDELGSDRPGSNEPSSYEPNSTESGSHQPGSAAPRTLAA